MGVMWIGEHELRYNRGDEVCEDNLCTTRGHRISRSKGLMGLTQRLRLVDSL